MDYGYQTWCAFLGDYIERPAEVGLEGNCGGQLAGAHRAPGVPCTDWGHQHSWGSQAVQCK